MVKISVLLSSTFPSSPPPLPFCQYNYHFSVYSVQLNMHTLDLSASKHTLLLAVIDVETNSKYSSSKLFTPIPHTVYISCVISVFLECNVFCSSQFLGLWSSCCNFPNLLLIDHPEIMHICLSIAFKIKGLIIEVQLGWV